MTRQTLTTIYAAPEFVLGEASVASDTWSLGMILFEIATGQQMSPAPNRLYVAHKPIDLSAIKNLELRQLVSRCFVVATERVTIEEIRAQLSPAMFGATAVAQPIGVIAPAVSPPAPIVVKSAAAQPPVKAAAQPIAKSPAVSQAPAVPAAPVGCNADFNQKWEQAHRGDAAAQLWIGKQFWNGWSGVEQDWSAAAIWFQKSAEGGNTDGMCWLGCCYLSGWGVEKDETKAEFWFKKSDGEL